MAGPSIFSWASALEEHPEYVNAIGMISIESANVDLAFTSMLVWLLGVTHEVAHAIYLTPKQATTRLDILRNLSIAVWATTPRIDLTDAEIAKLNARHEAIEGFYKRAYSVATDRNSIIHDLWGANENDAVFHIKLPLKEIPFETKPVSLIDLQRLVAKVRKLVEDIHAFTHELSTEHMEKLRQRHLAQLAESRG